MKRRSAGGYKKSSFLKWLGSIFQSIISLVWKILPFGFALALIYFTFFGIHEVLHADPYFQIKAIKIFPRGILSTEEYQTLERKCARTNILDYNLKSLSDFLLANPRVKEAKVYRRLPSDLDIFIVPRNPFVQLHLSPNGDYYTVDEEGIVMAKSKQKMPEIPVLSHYEYSKKSFNILERYQFEAFSKLSGIVKEFQANPLTKTEQISEFSVDHLGNYSIFLTNGPELKICQNASENLQKLDVVPELLAREKRTAIQYIDLCFDNVIVQPINEAPVKTKVKKAVKKVQ